MLPPSIVVELAERVRACRAQLDNCEAVADKARAEYNGYLTLLTYAESRTEVPAVTEQAWAPGDLVADSPHPAAPLDERPRGIGWCFCGLPGTPGMVHGSIRCALGKPDLTPALPPLGPPTAGAWFGSGTPGAFAPHIPANTGTDVTA